MEVLIVSQAEVVELLPMGECIGVMEQVFRQVAAGEAILPLRTVQRLPGDRILGYMPAYLGGMGAVGAKVITVYQENHGTEYDAHQGAVLLFETTHGSLQAIVDATAVTAIRTAAVSALATRLLAKENAGDLAILGAGTQARGHLEAMLQVRPIRRVRVWSRDAAKTQTFAAQEAKRWGIPVEAVASTQAAVTGADLVCTTTASREPVLLGEWLSPGAHVNAVGASQAWAREVDTVAVVRSRYYADRVESARSEAGEFITAMKENAVGAEHIVGELGDILTGKILGRTQDSEITLFKSLGLAIEDLAAAWYIYRRAGETGRGTRVELGGQHFARRD